MKQNWELPSQPHKSKNETPIYFADELSKINEAKKKLIVKEKEHHHWIAEQSEMSLYRRLIDLKNRIKGNSEITASMAYQSNKGDFWKILKRIEKLTKDLEKENWIKGKKG